ncbi:hypothetical protein vBAcoSR7M_9 [Alteromonas phage vB_AcoS-R7M]|uniref:Uncharacterized protein n=1 Tax=Alteromonas phage vB_AcoS-R7M TaxID=2729541 RepID=A0A6M3YNK0_9CAUD|nr:hypothetical protein HWD34_gp09 [Alteromonas phage vB_AcoS-R7M]QJI53331.1 hypothetical protein vBAcoSR7M_9 [Alteromonas phage vB_AcoS-R7M]
MNPISCPDTDWRVKPDIIETKFDAWFNRQTEIQEPEEVFKAGFLSGVEACQNGEYY